MYILGLVLVLVFQSYGTPTTIANLKIPPSTKSRSGCYPDHRNVLTPNDSSMAHSFTRSIRRRVALRVSRGGAKARDWKTWRFGPTDKPRGVLYLAISATTTNTPELLVIASPTT